MARKDERILRWPPGIRVCANQRCAREAVGGSISAGSLRIAHGRWPGARVAMVVTRANVNTRHLHAAILGMLLGPMRDQCNRGKQAQEEQDCPSARGVPHEQQASTVLGAGPPGRKASFSPGCLAFDD